MSALNLAQRLYVDDDGALCTVTNMFDAEGEETDAPEHAVILVVKRSESEWLTVDVRDFQDARAMSARLKLALTCIAVGAALFFAAWALRGLAMYAAGFFSAALLFCLFPELDVRVRALAGWARGLFASVGKLAPAPVARATGHTGPATPESGSYTAHKTAHALANIARFFAGLLGWMVHNWRLVLCVLIVVVILGGLSALKGCFSGSPFGESREHAIVRADQAEAEVRTRETIIERNDVIGEIARETAVARVQISLESERGRREIEAATPEAEAPLDAELVAAWRSALDGLCVYARADGSRPDTCGRGAYG